MCLLTTVGHAEKWDELRNRGQHRGTATVQCATARRQNLALASIFRDLENLKGRWLWSAHNAARCFN